MKQQPKFIRRSIHLHNLKGDAGLSNQHLRHSPVAEGAAEEAAVHEAAASADAVGVAAVRFGCVYVGAGSSPPGKSWLGQETPSYDTRNSG